MGKGWGRWGKLDEAKHPWRTPDLIGTCQNGKGHILAGHYSNGARWYCRTTDPRRLAWGGRFGRHAKDAFLCAYYTDWRVN